MSKSKVTTLLDKAKAAIKSAETDSSPHLREAAEFIAQAQGEGATRKQICERLGKSLAWLKFLLVWREGGYTGGAFERSHKSRKASRASQSKTEPKGPFKRRTRKADTRPDSDEAVTEREVEVDENEPEEFSKKAADVNPQNWMTAILLRADQSLQMCRDLEFLIAGAIKVAKDKRATRREIVVACRAVATAWKTQAQKIEDQNAETNREPQKASVL